MIISELVLFKDWKKIRKGNLKVLNQLIKYFIKAIENESMPQFNKRQVKQYFVHAINIPLTSTVGIAVPVSFSETVNYFLLLFSLCITELELSP